MNKQISEQISFRNQNVLLTGASRGLGRVIAEKFALLGANLFLVARTEQHLLALKNELKNKVSSDQNIIIIPTDLSDNHAIYKILDKILNTSSGVDILINNAAIQGPIGKSWCVDWQAWQQAFQINFFAPVQLMRLCIEGMIKKNYGKIINISGGGATKPRPYFASYATAKGALVNFSSILSIEVLAHHIDVNCIAPGVMNTTLLTEVVNAGADLAGKDEYKNAKEHSHLPDTMHQATELCLFLASKQSDGITGKIISAVWDSWPSIIQHKEKIMASDVYTIRRIVPQDRDIILD